MKKNIFGKLLCLFMAGTMAFGLAACTDGETPGGGGGGGPATYTVTFHMEGHGGTTPQPQTVNKGEYAQRPTPDPTDNEYDFGGWYKQGASSEFEFDTVAIVEDTHLYAKWEEKGSYTVTFHLEGHGDTAPATQTIDKGEHATAPQTDPTDPDYDFNGWYASTEEVEFDFAETPITHNTHLYASWTPKTAIGADTSTALSSTAKVYVVGDSTACDYSDKLDVAYLPRYGFGTQLANYLNCDPTQIRNLALSGRSSLSFLQEDNYKSVLKPNIKAGDYLIIAFGHNDEKVGEADRYTDPTGSHTEATKNGSTSFQYNLYENYVKLATGVGATPILCTPIVRYDESGNYTGSKVHNTAQGDYSAAVRTLAAATNTALVDLTEITKEIYKADNIEAQFYHSQSSYAGEKSHDVPTGRDDTHLNMYGAKVVAYALLNNLPSDCTLKASVKTDAVAPTHIADYAAAIRADYVRPEYAAPTLGNPIATINGTNWYGSVFGDLGGDSKVSEFAKSYNSSTQTFTVGNNGAKSSKFADAGDGLAVAFVQIETNKNFTISADVTLDPDYATPDGNQSGFGIMLRDDMYMNKDIKNIKSNFLAVGARGTSNAIFKRESETLANESGNTTTVNATTTYHLTLTRNGQNTTVTFSDGTHNYTKNYLDFKMNLIDKQYMYVCLFANRQLVAKFTNVVFTITGEDSFGA